MKAAAFARQFGEIRPVGPGRLEREALWRSPENAAEALWYRGLIFRSFADFGDGPMEYFYIPEDLPLPPRTGCRDPCRDRAPRHFCQMPLRRHRARHALNSLAVDACTVLARSAKTPLPSARYAFPAASPRAGNAGVCCCPIRSGPRLLLTLAAKLRLARTRSGTVGARQPAGWARGCGSRTGSRCRCCSPPGATAPRGTTCGTRRACRARASGRNDPALARRQLLRLLQRLDGRTWYRIADLSRLHKESADPDFQRPDGNYSGWYLRDAETGRYLSGFESWDCGGRASAAVLDRRSAVLARRGGS